MNLRELSKLLIGSNVMLMWKNKKLEVMSLLQPIYEIDKLSDDLLEAEVLRIQVNGVREEVGIFLEVEREIEVFNIDFHEGKGRMRVAKNLYPHVNVYETI